MRSISFLSTCIARPVTMGLLESVFFAIYVALLIMRFFSIANHRFNYMPRTVTRLAIRMILPLSALSFSTLVAIQSLGVPRNNAHLLSSPLKPNTDLSLPRLPSAIRYPIYSASPISPLLGHRSFIATMSMQPTFAQTRCSTHV